MKNIIINTRKLLLLVPISALLFSCTEKLDLMPKQSIDAEVALTTPSNIKATLVGAYLDGRSEYIFGTAFNEFSELYASTGDMLFLGTYEEPREFIQKEATVTNAYVENAWVQSYKLINTCNTLLDPEILAILDDEDRDLVEGEARFLRGWTYFELSRFFGLPYEAGTANTQPAVPLVLTPTSDVADAVNVPRNTVDECYAQALEDLTAARDLLPQDNGVYASSLAARAILSRVYLQMGNYAGAAAEANIVIQSGLFALTNTPLKAFNNSSNSPEDIFAFQNNVASNNPWLAVMYASLNGAGRGDYEIQQVFLDRFDPSDLRGMFQENTESFYTIDNISMMYYKGVGTIVNSNGINTSKWGNYYTNINLIRLAEMYLTRAEANFEDPGADVGPNTPTQDINVIRERANAPLYTAPVTRQQIREERYLELCWEGFRLHDLKRWKQSIGGYEYNAGNLILPIPFREMEVNDLLEQNSWYSGGK
ncbi:MAG: RagB/SusD family nutrient uptake outer membrane protein [Bacteroidales bacterium]|nr:RagB/SusD family nutrient uptake outer membrane protein [Bacteroidales bacterium]